MRATLDVIGVAVLAGLIFTTYDGAMVGAYRWGSAKLFVYSMASGALLFLVPYAVLAVIAFLTRLLVKRKWSALRTHHFALIGSAIIAGLLLYGGYYGQTHAVA